MTKAGIEELAAFVVNTGFHIHNELGPGLLESVYETVLAARLEKAGILVERQKPVSIIFDEVHFADAYRVDLFLENKLVIELNIRQTLTYVRLLNQPLGLLMNFGGESWKGNVKRIMNNAVKK
jgi:GxxExxY protein